MLLSASRDKTLIIWHLSRDDQAYGYPKRRLIGHNHIVSDCVCVMYSWRWAMQLETVQKRAKETRELTRILSD